MPAPFLRLRVKQAGSHEGWTGLSFPAVPREHCRCDSIPRRCHHLMRSIMAGAKSVAWIVAPGIAWAVREHFRGERGGCRAKTRHAEQRGHNQTVTVKSYRNTTTTHARNRDHKATGNENRPSFDEPSMTSPSGSKLLPYAVSIPITTG